MEKQNFTEKEIEEMKDEFDKSLKEFHDKAVPDIIKTLGTYPPIVALFGIGSIANAIIKQQFENDEDLREQFMMYMSSTNIDEVNQ
jgi:hypothetical protein